MKTLAGLKMNPELLEQVADCATPEELVALAKTQGVELPADEAEKYIAYLTRELTDEELSQVVGGSIWGDECEQKAKCGENC